MTKISICISGHQTLDTPKVKIFHNQNLVTTAEVVGKKQWIDFDIVLAEENLLALDFYNKEPHHTVIKDGVIAQDMSLELHKIRVDDVLLQTWFLNSGWYRPRYFDSFLQDFPDSPEKLESQMIWHFPGTFNIMPFPIDFWSWYHFERTNRITLENMDKDLHRWEKFVGSIERYQDIVDEIKELCRA